MSGQVYFGNANYQTWIKAPTSGLQITQTGFLNQQQLLSGRTAVKRSRASSRSMSPSWVGSLNSTSESLQVISDFATGLYGDGPYYWLDPFAIDQNILPPHWAAPHLTEKDWPKLSNVGTHEGHSFAYANGYPYRYITYTTAVGNTRSLRIIIPAGYTFHFGWHGTHADYSGVLLKATKRSDGTTSQTYPTSLLAGGTTRTNATVDGDTYSMVDISLYDSCEIVGMIGQILPNGISPASGGFISGRGTTGMEFTQVPTIEYYSSKVNNGQIGMSASFVEV